MTLATITLASGRSIELTSLQIRSTYGVWLEGYPNALMNIAQLDNLAKRREGFAAEIPDPSATALSRPGTGTVALRPAARVAAVRVLRGRL
jgi:hypothetical protein